MPRMVEITANSLVLDSDMDIDEIEVEGIESNSKSAKIVEIACGVRHALCIDENDFGTQSLRKSF